MNTITLQWDKLKIVVINVTFPCLIKLRALCELIALQEEWEKSFPNTHPGDWRLP